MKGSLKFENPKPPINTEEMKLYIALERKMALIDKDYDAIYYRHYQFNADSKRIDPLFDILQKFQMDLNKYLEILRKIKKMKGKKNDWKRTIYGHW